MSAFAPLSRALPTRERRRVLWSAVAVFLLAAFVTLVVPFWIPVAPIAAMSMAYLTGFNTRAADVGACLVMLLVLWLAWRGRLGELESVPEAQLRQRMSWQFMLVTMAVLLSGLAIAGWLVDIAQVRWHSDAGYFREQMQSFLLNGRHLYTQLEFPYGPMLMWLPAGTYLLLRPVGVSITGAYFVSLVVAQALGMIALGMVLNRLPIRTGLRQVGFVVLCFGSCVPLLGLNYTHVRFVPPLLILLVVPRLRSKAGVVAMLTAGAAIEMLISPEVGFAYLAACWCYAVLRWPEDRWYSLATLALPAMVAASELLALHSYLRFLISFGRGTFNLPLVPVPSTLVFLFAFTWLVPRAIGIQLRPSRPLPQEAVVHAAMFAYGVGMLPSTFARCDPLHVFFNGIAVLVLSLMAASRLTWRAGQVWTACVVVLVLWMQGVNLRLDSYQIRLASLGILDRLPASEHQAVLNSIAKVAPGHARRMAQPQPGRTLDLAQLEQFVGNSPVATPIDIEWPVEEELRRSGHFRSDYYSFTAGVMSLSAERRKIRALDEAHWALVPLFGEGVWTESVDMMGMLQGIPFPYPVRHHPLYVHNALIWEDLHQHWHPVADMNGYRLFEHTPAK